MNDFAIIISAPSGTGKSTLISKVFQDNSLFEFSVSTASRLPRNGEADGKNYYFVNEGEFKRRIAGGSFIEWAVVHGNYYGTEKKEIDRILARKKIPILDIDVQGAANVRESLPNGVYIFIVPPSLGVLRERLTARGTETDEQIRVRLGNAENEIRRYLNYDYIVINDDLDKAAINLSSIAKAEICRADRMAAAVQKILEDKK